MSWHPLHLDLGNTNANVIYDKKLIFKLQYDHLHCFCYILKPLMAIALVRGSNRWNFSKFLRNSRTMCWNNAYSRIGLDLSLLRRYYLNYLDCVVKIAIYLKLLVIVFILWLYLIQNIFWCAYYFAIWYQSWVLLGLTPSWEGPGRWD